MPRCAKSKISGISVRKTKNSSGDPYWRVRIGKRITGGKIIQKDFIILGDANTWRDEQLEQFRKTGTETADLTAKQIAEAKDASPVTFWPCGPRELEGRVRLINRCCWLAQKGKARRRGQRNFHLAEKCPPRTLLFSSSQRP